MYKDSENFALKSNEFVQGNSFNQMINQPVNENYAIEVKGDGNGIVLLFSNEDSTPAKVTLLGSDDVFCGGNMEIMVPPDGTSYYHLEGAPYVQKSGENKGKILLVSNAYNVYFTCIEVL